MTAGSPARRVDGSRLARWAAFDGLAPRLGALLTVALLPLGLVALDQTRSFSAEASRRAGLTLLSLTREGAAPIQQAVERALGAGDALVGVADTLGAGLTGGESCDALLSAFDGPGSPYAFVGILPRSGEVACSTLGGTFEISNRAAFDANLAAPRARVVAKPTGSLSGEDVLVISLPFGGSEPAGVVALSLRRDDIAAPLMVIAGEQPQRLVVFNGEGQVVSGADPAEVAALLPEGLDLAAEAGGGPRVYRAADPSGDGHLYAVAPLIPDVLYALGIWSAEQGVGAAGPLPAAPLLFPLGMWVASLLVAFWAANRLVVRPIATLGEQMRRFGADRSLPESPVAPEAPRELRAIDAAFRQTAAAILQDEARMEDAFRERGVLLREIHHRVKNNLQLISSIISMQMRRSPDVRTRIILRRLQDRVLTLAAIYRTLYTSQDMSETSVAPILRAIVEQEIAGHPGRVSLSLALDDVVLDADQAVPLSFLVAEGVSNAVLQAAQAEGERRVSVTLARQGAEVRLEVLNTMPSAPGAEPGGRAAGLGAQLIAAFAIQLGGRIETGPLDGSYRLVVTFPLGDGEGSNGHDESRLTA